MNPFNRFRLVHWMIAGLILACYFTEDSFERLHVWLGYGLIVFLIVRLILALKKSARFPGVLPQWALLKNLNLLHVSKLLTVGILAATVVTAGTGILMVDNTRIIGDAVTAVVPAAQAGGHYDDHDTYGDGHDEDEASEWLADVHEVAANTVLWLAGFHAAYLLAFRRTAMWNMLRGLKRRPAA